MIGYPTHPPRLLSGWLLIVLAALLCMAPATAQTDDPILITDWTSGGLAGWEVERFAGDTAYAPMADGDQHWLAADAHGTASGLVHKRTIDLTRTPYLNWSWRIREPLHGLDERSKSGDDYSARIYVIVSGGALFWRTRALNYVWSGSQASGSQWPNAFTSNARMVAVRGKDDPPGAWISEKRNVLEDLQQAFGERIEAIDAVAIMTDTDNSGGRTGADYGRIWFSAD